MEPQTVGLMGGSFDPIHLGHIQLASIAHEQAQLSTVLFLVSGNPPHKKSLGGSAQQRLEMARLALRDFSWASVSEIELRSGTVYTVDTLHLLRERMPGTDFWYIIGSDTLLDLHSWRRFPDVAGLCGFLCAMRSGADQARVLAETARLAGEYGARIRFLKGAPDPVSSTLVRERLEAGSPTEGLLDKNVRSYIDQNGLYRKETALI